MAAAVGFGPLRWLATETGWVLRRSGDDRWLAKVDASGKHWVWCCPNLGGCGFKSGKAKRPDDAKSRALEWVKMALNLEEIGRLVVDRRLKSAAS